MKMLKKKPAIDPIYVTAYYCTIHKYFYNIRAEILHVKNKGPYDDGSNAMSVTFDGPDRLLDTSEF